MYNISICNYVFLKPQKNYSFAFHIVLWTIHASFTWPSFHCLDSCSVDQEQLEKSRDVIRKLQEDKKRLKEELTQKKEGLEKTVEDHDKVSVTLKVSKL